VDSYARFEGQKQNDAKPKTQLNRHMPKRPKRWTRWIAAGAGVLTATTLTNARCAEPSDPLLDMLIKKGILTEQEAREIQAEAQTNAAPAAPSKWHLSNSIKNIGLFGDVRFRYEYRGADNVVGGSPGTYYRERFRYALRAGIKGELFDHFNYGIRLETSSNPRSTWITFADDTSPTPSAKSSDGVAVGQIYLGWKPADWYEMVVGKMPMPLYTTTMVWDSDINPEGAFEKFKLTVSNTELFAGFGQFIYQDQNPDHAIPSSDTWLLAFQAGANMKIDERSSFKIAPVIYVYAGRGTPQGASGATQLGAPFIGQGTATGANPNTVALNQNGINDLLVFEVPAEYNFKLDHYALRAFGDFAYNLQGDDRARAAFNAGFPLGAFPASRAGQPPTGHNTAYLLGLAFGTAAGKRNSWNIQAGWQHVEQYAIDVNLIDSDLFEGRANLEGVFAAVSCNLTDAIVGTIRYAYAQQIDGNLGTGGNNGDLPGLNPVNNYNLLQLDLAWKF